MRPFRHPIDFHTLEAFCHPDPAHVYHRPALLPCGDAFACNTWIAIKCSSGLWAPDDFQPSPAGFAERFARLPFDPFPHKTRWVSLENHRGRIYRDKVESLFTPNHKVISGPLVNVIGFVVPLGMLQHLMRLPRFEFSLDPGHHRQLFGRFNGGIAILSCAKGSPSFLIDPIFRDHTGREVAR